MKSQGIAMSLLHRYAQAITRKIVQIHKSRWRLNGDLTARYQRWFSSSCRRKMRFLCEVIQENLLGLYGIESLKKSVNLLTMFHYFSILMCLIFKQTFRTVPCSIKKKRTAVNNLSNELRKSNKASRKLKLAELFRAIA